MEDITMSRSDRNKKAAIFGVVLGLIYIILSTITNLTVAQQLTLYGVMTLLNYILYFVILGFMAKMIRKANGGFMEFKELFGTIFVILLVSASMTYLYNWVFMNYIDPHFTEKVLEAARLKIEQSPLPDEQIDELLKNMDKESAGAKSFDVLAWAGLIVRDCVFGWIVAAIMKKSKPVFE